MTDIEAIMSNMSNLPQLAVTDPIRVRTEFEQWCRQQLSPPPGSHRILSFHSTYSPEPNGFFTVWSELYDRSVPEGDPLEGSARVVAVDVSTDSDTAWRLCEVFRDALNRSLPGLGASVG